jgi:chloramphenicol O-acetyltransferase type A
MYDIIDIDQWKRKDLFRFFEDFDNPTWDLMCDVRITPFYHAVKTKDYSFFLSFIYAGSLACNAIDELRCRIDQEGNVRQYHLIHPGSTILYDNETYGYGYFDFHQDFKKFMTQAKIDFERQKKNQGVDPKEDDLARIYFSPIPWVYFTGFRHPYRKGGNASIPMVVFGKYYERDGELYLPVGLTLHHGLADGFHAGKFFSTLQDILDQPADYLGDNR